jgi:hypothetical protein
METRFETAGRDCGSNDIPGVESVTARLILEEMLVKNKRGKKIGACNKNGSRRR